MSFYPKGFLTLALLLFLGGAGWFLCQDNTFDSPPHTERKALPEATTIRQEEFDLAVLIQPWYRKPPPVVTLAPKPSAPPPPTADKKSVAFLGLYHEKEGTPAYFFKFLPSGKVMILKPGQPNKGWELVDVQTSVFLLTGPGGRYEVSR